MQSYLLVALLGLATFGIMMISDEDAPSSDEQASGKEEDYHPHDWKI